MNIQGSTPEPAEAIKTPPTPEPATTANSAARAVAMGYFPVPIPHSQKSPSSHDWQKRRDTADTDFDREYPDGSNLGIILGPSKLVDADLDSAVALQLVSAFLPESTMVWGRRSKSRSHHAYKIMSGKVVHRKYTDLTDHVLLERRTGNNQTLIPPSTNPSGETVEWVLPGPASEVNAGKIAEAFDDFGAACLLATVWNEGVRQELALYVAGYLLKAGCPQERVRRIIYPVIENYDDPRDIQKRHEAVEQTIRKFEQDANAIAGLTKLQELLGQDRAKKLVGHLEKWLGLLRVSDDDRALIDTRDRGLDAVGDEAFNALVRANEVEGQPVIFQFDRLVCVRVDGTGWPVVETLSDGALRGRMARVATWIGGKPQGPGIEIPPPDVVVKNVQSRLEGWSGIPVLRRVVQFPFFMPDGTLSTTRGYQPDTMVWLHISGCHIPDIPEKPTDEDLIIARTLLDELLIDFPFESPSSKAQVVGMMLLPLVRELIDGPTPLHMLTAPTPRTGKSLLNELTSVILTGQPPRLSTPPRNEEEWRKFLLAMILSGAAHVTLDNLSAKLDSGAFAELLMSKVHTDRILGVSQLGSGFNRALWVATGNNVELSGEIAERSVWIRVVPNVEFPGQRTGFKHRLPEWAVDHRGELLGALLTMARAWFARGRPQFTKRTKGGFEQWCQTIGGILDVVGVEGFLENDREQIESADPEHQELAAFVTAWAAQHGVKPVTAGELAEMVGMHGLLETVLDLEGKTPKAQATALGLLARRMADRVFAGHKVVCRDRKGYGRTAATKRTTTYRLEFVEAAA